MSRPKGSKNKSTILKEKETEQQPFIDSETKKQYNTYDEYISNYVEGFIARLYNQGILKTIDINTLQNWFANPDTYINEINNLLQYYFIVNGDIFQLYDLVSALPTLNYKIDIFDRTVKNEKYISTCITALNSVKHRQLTRDILSQTISEGTLVGMWLGDKDNPYFFIFDDLKYVFPSYRLYGQWIAELDLEWLRKMKDDERQIYFNNLSPYVTEDKYNKYLNNSFDKKYRYIELPTDRTAVIRTHTTKRNQRLGLPWGTQAIFDMQHKQKLKDLETSVANKIINAISVVKFQGKDESGTKINENKQKKVFSKVKQALEQNSQNGITVIAIPDFASFEFPKFETGDDVLDPKKYTTSDNDISAATGVSYALTNGTGSNFSSAKLNLQTLYRKIGVILEVIEDEVYQRLFNIVLPAGVSDSYHLTYDKAEPLTKKDKVDILSKLHFQEGFSLKAVIDQLEDTEWNSYIEQSLYEQENMKLPEKIKPYTSAYTNTGDPNNPGGAPTVDDPDNPNTISSKTTGGNDSPDAKV